MIKKSYLSDYCELLRLEILEPDASPPPSRPGSSKGRKAKDNKVKGAKTTYGEDGNELVGQLAPTSTAREGGEAERQRAKSGPLEGNPYRWVVSWCEK